MLCAPAGIVEDIKFTLYDTGRWTFLDEKEEFVPRLLMWVASSCSRSDWQLEKPGTMGLVGKNLIHSENAGLPRRFRKSSAA
jgi:hypothetical protein